jgi:hypothetical protein
MSIRKNRSKLRQWTCVRWLVGIALLASCASPSVSLAGLSRPFVFQLAGTGSAEEGQAPFSGPYGVAVDAHGDLWVGNGVASPHEIGKFEMGSRFLPEATIALGPTQAPPVSVAVSAKSGELFVAGIVANEAVIETFDATGKPIANTFPRFDRSTYVAVDNSADASSGDVYVAIDGNHRGGAGGLQKFTATGAPLEFGETHSLEIPGGEFRGVTVDGDGNVDVLDFNPKLEGIAKEAVVQQYRAGGQPLHTIGEAEAGDWEGGEPDGIAADPVSKHLLVAVSQADRGVVQEFDAEGHLVGTTTQVPKPNSAPTPCGTPRSTFLGSAGQIAIGPQGELYVVDSQSHDSPSCEAAVDAYGSARFVPSLRLGEVSEVTEGTAVLSGSVNPEGRPLTGCNFRYVTEEAFQHNVETAHDGFADLSSGGQVPCEPGANEIAGVTATAVRADLIGLAHATTYRFQLAATSSGEEGGTAVTEAGAFTSPAAPEIVSTAITSLTSQFAVLEAKIDPVGANTHYFFEYVDDAHFHGAAEEPFSEAARLPVAPAGIGSGGGSGRVISAVSQDVSGLQPGIKYHFRVVAENSFGVSLGPEEEFTTLAAAGLGLPDERAYELVTPVSKGGSADLFSSPVQFFNADGGFTSLSGDEYLMPSTVASFGPAPTSENNSYIFTRTVDGWHLSSVATTAPSVQSVQTELFDPVDLSKVAFTDQIGSESSVGRASRTSLVGPPGGPYIAMHRDGNLNDETTEPVGASTDLSHVMLESTNHELAGGAKAQTAGADVYEFSGGGTCEPKAGGCKLVNLKTNNTLESLCGAVLGQGEIAGTRKGAVSTDGARVIFTAPDPYVATGEGECWNLGTSHAPQIYERVDGKTLEVSAPELGVTEGGEPPLRYAALFVGASEDGRKIFFLTRSELTKEAESLKLHDKELYECEVVERGGEPGCVLSRLSGGEEGVSPGGVVAVPAVSGNGAAVYFMAAEKLTSNAAAVTGEEVDLYRFDTTTHTTAYIAQVGESDYPKQEASQWPGEEYGQVALSQEANWYTTPDGQHLLFATAREILGGAYSTAGSCPVGSKGGGSRLAGHCAEIYNYDAANGSLICVSCNPSGAGPVSNAQIGRRSFVPMPASGLDYPLSNDGAYAFFDTADALVPNDTNGTLDVYEWHEGHISLISSGTSPAPSYFLGASPDGANIFFGTHARLVRQDTDDAGDVYDARIHGGFSTSGSEVECEGDACQNAPPPPVDATPGSQTYSGPGNFPPAPTVSPPHKVSAVPTRAQRLAAALKACRKKHGARRKKCEALARRKYGHVARRARAAFVMAEGRLREMGR